MSAYYKRNNSYSRSYNASVAESEGRLPLTRAASWLGLSIKAFKSGLDHADISASEWHHVGKYANRIDYYDVPEIKLDPKFWIGARNKSNKDLCNFYLKKIASLNLKNKMVFKIPDNGIKIEDMRYYTDSFNVRIKKETQKNISKAIRDIYYKYFLNKKEESISLFPPQPKYFFLNPDGSIVGNNNRNYYYSQINWDEFGSIEAAHNQGSFIFRKS